MDNYKFMAYLQSIRIKGKSTITIEWNRHISEYAEQNQITFDDACDKLIEAFDYTTKTDGIKNTKKLYTSITELNDGVNAVDAVINALNKVRDTK